MMRSRSPSRFLPNFQRDNRGVAAIEFAFIAPVMIIMYFGVAELCTVMMADRRASHASSAVGDLAAQTDKLRDGDVSDIFASATTIMSPFEPAPLQLRLTRVTVDSALASKVDWSEVKSSGQADLPVLACKATVAMPASLPVKAGDHIIVSEAVYSYNSPIGFVLKRDFKFTSKQVMAPRQGDVARYKLASTTPYVCP